MNSSEVSLDYIMKERHLDKKSASFSSWGDYKIRLEHKKQAFVQGHTSWVNGVLKQTSVQPIQDLRLSVMDGLTVVVLLEILGNEQIGGVERSPLTKPQKVQNLQHCVEFLEGQGVDVQGLSPKELADGNLKSTLMLMNSIRKKYDAQYSHTKDGQADSPKLKPRHSVTSLPSYMTREVSEGPPPPPPPRRSTSNEYNNNHSMIGKKLPPPPPPLLPTMPPPVLPSQQPVSGGLPVANGQRSASPPVDFLPGTMSGGDEKRSQVELGANTLKVTSTEVDQYQVSQMGPEGQHHSYSYAPDTAQHLKEATSLRRAQTGAPPPSSPGPPSRVAQAWQANSGPNTPTASRARTAQNSKGASGPSVQEQLNQLLNGGGETEGGTRNTAAKGHTNGAYQPDEGELLVVPPPSAGDSSRNKASLTGFPSSYQPSLLSERPPGNSSRSQTVMSQQKPHLAQQPQHPASIGPHTGTSAPLYRGATQALPKYQPPPQYSPGGAVQGQRVSGGSESSVFTSGSSNSTPTVLNNGTAPPRQGGMASNDLRNAWNKLYGLEPKVQNNITSQSMENFNRPKTPTKQTASASHSRQGSQVSQHHRRSSPMGQSSSPRSHSSSSQGGVSSNETHPPPASHTHSASLDNTKSLNDSIPLNGGHVSVATYQVQGVVNNQNNFSNRYPEDRHNSQPLVNGVNVPKSPVRSAAPPVLHNSSNRTGIPGYEQNGSSAPVGYSDQRPKTPVLSEQRPKTPTNFDHQRQASNPNYDLQSYPAGNVNQNVKNQQQRPMHQTGNIDVRLSSNGQDHVHNNEQRNAGYQSNQFSDQRHPGYNNNSLYMQEMRPKTPVGHEQRPTTPHEQKVPVALQQSLPLSNGLPQSTKPVNIPINDGATDQQDIKSWKTDSLGRRTNAVQQRMEQLKQKSKESHSNYENMYTGHEFTKLLSSQTNRQKSQEEMLQMQELPRKQSIPVTSANITMQEHKSTYLNNRKVQGTSNMGAPEKHKYKLGHHRPPKDKLTCDLSDGSITPPLPALSPDNTPPVTPPESPGHVKDQRRVHAQYLPHSTNDHHVLAQSSRIKPPSGRRQAKKNGHAGAKTKKSHSSRHGTRNGHSSHSRSSHGRHRLDQMTESQGEDYVEDSELASTADLEIMGGAGGMAPETQEGKVIRQQLEGLETMYTEILKVLGIDKDYLPGSRRSISSTSSMSQVTGNRRFRRTNQRRELKHVNKRFQRLESHVVTLARSVAQLSSEMHSQGALYQELDDIKLEMGDVKRAVAAIGNVAPQRHEPQNEWEKFRGWVPGLTNPKRVNKLKQFFGAEPPLLNIFLKKLGYESYTKNFENERITMIELPYLNEQRLEKIGIPMGPRLRILQESQLCFRQENFDIYIV